MEFRPMYDTETIKFQNSSIAIQSLETKSKTDPSGAIPNGIYKVIHGERRRQIFTLGFSGAVLLASIILIALYATVYQTSGIGFAVPIIVGLLAAGKAMVSGMEMGGLKKSVARYREDLRIGLSSTPAFLPKLYFNLHKKQVRHNGATFFLMFYGGIFTLLLGGLKDVNGGIFHFDSGIKSLFSNPTVMTGLFTFSLIAIVVLHIVFAIQRKRRMLEIDAYFGSQLMPQSTVEDMRTKDNKFYRRLFIFSVMIVLIIPIVIKIILRVFRKK